MLRRLYVDNYRCLQKFELLLDQAPSWLLIGRNGAGKSTVGFVLEILQKVASGTNRVADLVHPGDLTADQSRPVRIEVQVVLDGREYQYLLGIELLPGFRELCIGTESLEIDGRTYYSRSESAVRLESSREKLAEFRVDWHLIALPIIQEASTDDPLYIFRRWLARMIILAPLPSLMTGESKGQTLAPNRALTNYGEWFTGIIAQWPAAYGDIERYARDVMPDFLDMQNPVVGEDARSIQVTFSKNGTTLKLPFKRLSDGEKCFFVCALVLAVNHVAGPTLCFWDEPDSHLSLSEVGHFVMDLRKSFQPGGQLLVVSHNPEAIRQFSDTSTQVLYRDGHFEPTLSLRLSETAVTGDFVNALIRNDIAP